MLVLIVDDIQIIRAGIISAMKGRFPHFSFLEAEDGNDAFSLVEKHQVDFMITDIKMPRCGGLELLAKLRSSGLETPVIILSGFGEFEYAKKAIELGASGYLLKPVENEQLYQAVDCVTDKIHRSKSIQQIEEENQLLSRQSKQERMTHALQNALLLSSPLPPAENFAGKSLCLAVIGIEKDFYEKTVFNDYEINLVRYAINNIIEYLEVEPSSYLMEHPSEERQLLLLFYGDSPAELQHRVYMAMQKINFELVNTINAPVSVGVSDVRDVVDSSLYSHAATALGQRVMYHNCGVYLYHQADEKNIAISLQDIHLLNQYISQRDLDHFEQLLTEKLREYARQTSVMNAVNIILPVIVQSLIQNYGCPVFELSEILAMSARKLGQMNDIGELADRIVTAVGSFFKANNITPQQEDHVVDRVREYIDSHYSEDISVRMLAVRFNINYAYLSSLFAKKTGIGIAAYGMNVRMEAAKILLSSTSSDIAAIANMVGYEDLQYFYRVFKKQMGETPLSYRNNTKKIQ